ncbi:MAG TPA: MBL fold metallo-hydrolase [Oscillospiraceae bacterium]|nr:MBL fold metallo-hydrolase [Oscillospiraceae bacterium]
MKITAIEGGMLPTNCYLLSDDATGKTAVIDPGFDSPELENAIQSVGDGNVSAILLTHGHFDHILGVNKVKSLTNAPVYIYSDDALFPSDNSLNLVDLFSSSKLEPFTVDVALNDGDTIKVGNLRIKVIHTPGHTAGGCCYCVEDAIFTGDTLMKCSAGRTDFPTGSYSQILSSLEKLKNLKGDYHLYPGHGEESTLEFERTNNPFLRKHIDDFDY